MKISTLFILNSFKKCHFLKKRAANPIYTPRGGACAYFGKPVVQFNHIEGFVIFYTPFMGM